MTRRVRTPPTDLPQAQLLPYEIVDERLASPPEVMVVDGARSFLDVPIATVLGWRPLRVDVHLPLDGEGPFPVCVYAHGGAFVGGVKAMGPWAGLPQEGIAVVSVDYRLAREVVFPDNAEDVATAIRWARRAPVRYQLDGGRVAGWGSSAGGFLMGRVAAAGGTPLGEPVAELADSSPAVDAVVLHYPPTDLLRIADEAAAAGASAVERRVWESIRRIFGAEPGERGPAEEGSVIGAVGRAPVLPPFHIAHGDADVTVPIEQSRALRDALLARGVDVELIEVPGGGHGTPEFFSPDLVGLAVRFLRSRWDL